MAITWSTYQQRTSTHDSRLQKRIEEKRAIVHTYMLHIPGVAEPVERVCSEASLENLLKRACLHEVKKNRTTQDGKIHVYGLDNYAVYK